MTNPSTTPALHVRPLYGRHDLYRYDRLETVAQAGGSENDRLVHLVDVRTGQPNMQFINDFRAHFVAVCEHGHRQDICLEAECQTAPDFALDLRVRADDPRPGDRVQVVATGEADGDLAAELPIGTLVRKAGPGAMVAFEGRDLPMWLAWEQLHFCD
jgi:hypothetical protein